MVHLHATDLEAFRRCCETEYGDEEQLIRALSGNPDSPNPLMQAGTEFHRLLASNNHNVVRYGRDYDTEPTAQFRFDGEAVLKARKHVGPGIPELTGRRVWEIDGEQVSVVGTADLVHGLLVQDHKAKFSDPDPSDYAPSLQWRLYLLIHQAQVFRYNLFSFKDPKEDGFCELRSILSFKQWPYREMEADVKHWLGRFVDWARQHDLLPHLQQERRLH